MDAELIVVNGPLAGKRFPLSSGELVIGRAPNSQIVLSEPEVGWRHTQVRQQAGRFLVTDLKTSAGTFINGVRSAERWLEDRDQIGVVRTVFMFRSGEYADVPPVSQQTDAQAAPVLLAACSLLFLFRALAASEDESQLLQTQILRLVRDLVPAEDGILLTGVTIEELDKACSASSSKLKADFRPFIQRVVEEGATSDDSSGIVGVPLYLLGALGGVLLVRLIDTQRSQATKHLPALTAIGSIAGVGFEANREVETLKATNELLQEQIGLNTGLVGESAPMRRLLQLIERVAPRDTTVLITGESGTGKELIARALHTKSPRAKKPFIAVNCAALTENLFESELFGHEKGAFTGAISLKHGRFELANEGTIFLDEVGELAHGLQAKLLRVLQQREFERVGGTQAHAIDIRVIAATNRELTEDVKDGKFREDLYHRLNVVTLQSPPLRDRRDDIPLLARFFLKRSAERCKRQVLGLTPEAETLLTSYSWPGNVRELENAMERAVVMGESDYVFPEDLPEALMEASPGASDAKYHHNVDQAKRESIIEAYIQAKGDYKQAAKLLGIHPNYLLRLVRNMGLRDEINRRLSGSDGNDPKRPKPDV